MRLVTGGIAATALVQAGNAFAGWDEDAANGLLLAAAFGVVGARVAARGAAPALGWALVAVGAAGAVSVVAPEDLVLVPGVLFARGRPLCQTGPPPSPRWAGTLAVVAPLGLVLDADWMLVAVPLAALGGRLRHPCEIVRRQVLCVLLGCAAALFALALDASWLPGAGMIGALAIPL